MGNKHSRDLKGCGIFDISQAFSVLFLKRTLLAFLMPKAYDTVQLFSQVLSSHYICVNYLCSSLGQFYPEFAVQCR